MNPNSILKTHRIIAAPPAENSCNGYRCGNLAEQVWKLGSALSIMVFGAAFIQDKLSS